MNVRLRLVGVDLPPASLRRAPYATAIVVAPAYRGGVAVVLAGRATLDPGVARPAGADDDGPGSLPLDLLLFDGDPGPWLLVRGAVMHSDSGYRRAGARLDHARHAVDGGGLGAARVAAGIGPIGVAAVLVDDAARTVADLLATVGDRVLLDFEVRLDGVDEIRSRAGEFAVGSGPCVARFSLEVSAAAAAESPASANAGRRPRAETGGGDAPEPGAPAPDEVAAAATESPVDQAEGAPE